MAEKTFQEQQLQLAVESLYEDERLRSNLTDDTATLALTWGERQLQAALPQDAPDEETVQAEIERATTQVKKSLRTLNKLVAQRQELPEEELREKLVALLEEQGGNPEGVAALQKQALTDEEFVTGLLALFEPPASDEATATVEEEAQSPPPTRALLAAPEEPSLPDTPDPDESPKKPGTQNKGPYIAYEARRKRTTRKKESTPLNTLIFVVVLIVVAVFAYYESGLPVPEPVATLLPGPTSPPAPTGAAWYDLYFTTPLYPDDVAAHTGSIDEHLAAFIDSATSTVDMAIYQLDSPPVVRALHDAVARGVTVRIVTSTEIMEDEEESEAFVELADAGVVVIDGNPNAIMHNKFVVVDGQAVWTGSWNFTEHDTYRYNNHGILLRSPDLARNYTATFEKMWGEELFGRQREPGGTTSVLTIEGITVENYFAPEDATSAAIVARLNQAQDSIHFMAFSFTDDEMGDAILARAEAGVEVHGIFENTGSNTEFSEFGRMSAAGLDVIQDGNPYLMHHKVFIIDSRTVILGSFNFSANARDRNDENLLIIDDPALAQQFLAEFQRLYAQAQNPPNR